MRYFHAEVLPAETLHPATGRTPAEHAGTTPRIIRWTLPTGRHYDVIDDHDPAAATDETAHLHHLIRRADILIAKQDHHRRHHNRRHTKQRHKQEARTRNGANPAH